MSAITAYLGINTLSSSLVERVTISKKTTLKTIRDYDSGFGAAATFDPIITFEVNGRGSNAALSLGVASGSGIPSSISGGITIITATGARETSEDHQEWHYSGTNYPGAS
jgi:uncharacterized membrane protein